MTSLQTSYGLDPWESLRQSIPENIKLC